MVRPPSEITQLLHEWNNGNQTALGRLTEIILPELRRRASAYLRGERRGHTLETNALINELYLQLVGQSQAAWESHAIFSAACSQIMRHILVDHARKRQAERRWGGAIRVTFDHQRLAFEKLTASGQKPALDFADVLVIHAAVDTLAKYDPYLSELVVNKFFGGMTIDELAAAHKKSTAQVERDWRAARNWLYLELGGGR